VGLVIGVDCDGVLASFEHGYAPLLTKHSGIEFPKLGQKDWPTCWDWEFEAGVTKEQADKVWAEIKSSGYFWERLPACEGAPEFLSKLAAFPADVYFITRRMGKNAKHQTEYWLSMNGWKGIPTVILSPTYNKAGLCENLGLTHFIDDKTETCENIRNLAPGTKIFMLSRPWNREIMAVPRLKFLGEFYIILKETANGSNRHESIDHP